jgi:hypothetical protein
MTYFKKLSATIKSTVSNRHPYVPAPLAVLGDPSESTSR